MIHPVTSIINCGYDHSYIFFVFFKSNVSLFVKRKGLLAKTSLFGFSKIFINTLLLTTEKTLKLYSFYILCIIALKFYAMDEEMKIKRPEMISFYNSIKVNVDTVDQLCAIYNVTRKTNR